MDIGSATLWDQLSVTGLVQFTGNVELSFPSYNPRDGLDVFTLVLNDEADAITRGGLVSPGAGVLLGEGAIFTAVSGANSQVFELSYAGGSGNDVVLRAIPEPGSGVALILGGLLVHARRRRGR